jgi:hypothetical protein
MGTDLVFKYCFKYWLNFRGNDSVTSLLVYFYAIFKMLLNCKSYTFFHKLVNDSSIIALCAVHAY